MSKRQRRKRWLDRDDLAALALILMVFVPPLIVHLVANILVFAR